MCGHKLTNILFNFSLVIQEVLDGGTGTFIWAIDFADSHPESLVIGIDLSPIHPAWVTPNVSFEICSMVLINASVS
jgi:hypothetical protein